MDLQYSTPPGPPQSISSGDSMSSPLGDLGGPAGSVYSPSVTSHSSHHHYQQQQQQQQQQQHHHHQFVGQGRGPLPQDPQAQAQLEAAAAAAAAASVANSNANGNTNGGSTPSVPAACLACRSKHLKCDGQTPCARCVSSQLGSECRYIASRRGYKGARRGTAHNPNKRHASSSPDADIGAPESCPMLLGANPGAMGGGDGTAPAAAAAFPGPGPGAAGSGAGAPFLSAAVSMNHLQLYSRPSASAPFADPLMAVTRGAPVVPPMSIADRCFESYYAHSFASHPFLLPKDALFRHMRKTGQKLDHLVAAVRYVGALYLDAGPARANYLDEALRLAHSPTTPKDGFLVQALLLLIVALDGSCDQDRARELLGEAEAVALEIGLNTRQFAAQHGRGDPVLEESWRRTWWDLYVVDGMVAGVHRVTNFALYDIPADVALPCEEADYLAENIPQPPMYMEDFDDQVFTCEDRPFSSFTLRVAAIRNLGRFMRCPPIMFPEDENLGRMDAYLTNWRLHLPPAKRDPIDKNCAPDEMLFQAHFITTACTIMLHQPHSQLDASPARSVNSCAPYRPVPSGDAFNTHTRHTITAACAISKMITHAVPLHHHTHFFTCVITMAATVHLSKWALYFIQDEEDLRQQIRLCIGALSKLSVVWRAAGRAGGQVRGVAQEIYRAKKASQITPAYWVGFTQEQMMSSLNVDEGVMSEIDEILSGVTSAPPPQ